MKRIDRAAKHPGFAERFQQAVTRSGVKDTQKSLAKLLGVSEVMIWSYKNGEKLPRMAMAVKIAETFNTSVEWLLQGSGSAVKENSPTYQIGSTPSKTTKDIMALLKTLSEDQRKEVLNILKKTFKA